MRYTISGTSDDLVQVRTDNYDAEYVVNMDTIYDQVIIEFNEDEYVTITYNGCWKVTPIMVKHYYEYIAENPLDDVYSDVVVVDTDYENYRVLQINGEHETVLHEDE